jgi:hypothetical protein
MVKRKSRAEIRAADGAGGMSLVEDLRFAGGDWPIRLDVSGDDADRWLMNLAAECRKRNWQHTALKQMDRHENSGTVTVRDDSGLEVVSIVWERRKDGPLKVKARPSTSNSTQLIEATEQSCRARTVQRFYRRGVLRYSGLPWRGELWLTDSLRLGSPSQQDGTALLGPRYIIVDAQVEAIDWPDAASHFDVLLREVAVFLTVVLRMTVTIPDNERDWTWTMPTDGSVKYEVRQIGYGESNNPVAMPSAGPSSIPSRSVSRPDWSIGGISAADTEQVVPEDIVSLWHGFVALSADRRQQFQQAASLYQLALMLFARFRTASFAFMVAACEALKPGGDEFREHNAYHVIEALLGKGAADQLRSHPVRPQDVRSVHFHRGEFRGDEFLPRYFLASFDDPTFDESLRHLARVSHNAIIEWLKNGGAVVLPPVRRRATWKSRIREHALGLLILALLLGWLLGILTR